MSVIIIYKDAKTQYKKEMPILLTIKHGMRIKHKYTSTDEIKCLQCLRDIPIDYIYIYRTRQQKEGRSTLV